MNIHEIYEFYLKSGQVTSDSRKCLPGTIFFALKGDKFDGNNFASDALKNGCSYAIVDNPELKNKADHIWVPDALRTLQQLATLHRLKSELKVIAITGSNGKTTTKELISVILAEKYRIWSTQGNLNNHIGVPLTLLSIPPGTQIAVVEMGANHKGEISDLCEIAQPDMGLITNIGKAHLEGFGSLEGVKQAKKELYSYLIKHGGEIFINDDNPILKDLLGDHLSGVYRYGGDKSCEVCGSYLKSDPLMSFQWKSPFSEWTNVQTQLTGTYNFENALAAVIVGVHFAVPQNLINSALTRYKPLNYRSQLLQTKTNKIVLDAYNANPSSMQVALKHFDTMKASNKIVILGEMKEVGKESHAEHKKIIAQLQTMSINKCILVGNEFKNTFPHDEKFLWFLNSEDLLSFINRQPLSHSLILIKGSRINKLEKLSEFL